jgi:mRNA-degrading endonuclease YafQ of YafQ-DinJ toxin-antitoxin module
MSKFVATEEQENALTLSAAGDTMKLIAYAGAGKTATLVLIANQMQECNKRGMYLAFNKSIATDAAQKLPSSCVSKTFHSLALSGTPKKIKAKIAFSNNNVPEGKLVLSVDTFERHIAPDLADLVATGKSMLKGEVVTKEVSKSKQYVIVKKALNDGFMRDDTDNVELNHVTRFIKSELGLEIQAPEIFDFAKPLLAYAQKIWEDYKSADGLFCIGHDVYLKLYALSNSVIKTDYILFDEAQDADPLMLQVLKAQTTQVIYVGDPHQQIYEWRGAVNAMQKIAANYSYLTKSFRFGEPVGAVANTFLSFLGETKPLRHNELVDSIVTDLSFKDANVVLCCTNSGAIEACLEALQTVQNISLELSGIKQMQELISDIHDFISRPNLYKDHYLLGEFTDYRDLDNYCNNGTDVNPDIARPYKLYNKYGYDDLMRVFRSCRRSNNADLAIMTVHGSKGREWPNVKIYNDFEGISFSLKRDKETNKIVDFSTTDADVRLMYVAITRAKIALDVEGVAIALDHLPIVDNFKFEQPNEIRLIEPVKQPKQALAPVPDSAEKSRQKAAKLGQQRAIAEGVEFGRPKIALDDYLNKYSEVVEALGVGGLTYQEIATLTGASVATIKRVKQKAWTAAKVALTDKA